MASTTEKAKDVTPERINEKILGKTRAELAGHLAGGREGIDQRLRALDREWDLERALETGAATLTLTGTALGAFVHRRFLVLPAAVAGFLLQHAIQGWCPPLPVFRALGFRTAREIDEERYALKAARGDFVGWVGRKEAEPLLQASRS